MKHTRDSRKPDQAAKEKAAATGENDVKEAVQGGAEESGAPRSWKQYIEQSMPVREQKAGAEPEAQPKQAGPDVKEEAKALLERFLRQAKKAGKAAMSAAGAGWDKVNDFTAGGWEKAGQATEKLRSVVARHPVSPLLYVTLLAVGVGVWAFKGTYVRAYAMEVNGQPVALVSGQDEADEILGNVETRVASILGEDYGYEAEVTLAPVYTVPDALSDVVEVEDALFEEVGAYMTAYAISVDGVELGCAADKNELYRMLDEIAQPYIPEDAVRYEFVEDVQVYPVELPSNTQFDVEPIRAELSSLRVEQAVYVVEKGDTFNAIAYSLDMMPNELSVLNPDVIVDKLWVGRAPPVCAGAHQRDL